MAGRTDRDPASAHEDGPARTAAARTADANPAAPTLAGGRNPHSGRRLGAVLAMLIGAAVGASLLLHQGPAVPLAIAAGTAAATGVATYTSRCAAYLDK